MIQDSIDISVVFALPDEQRLFDATVASTATVEEAIAASGILAWYPQIDLGVDKVGIYGKIVSLTNGLEGGDRIEIYRSVTADPRSARQKRASASRGTESAFETGEAS